MAEFAAGGALCFQARGLLNHGAMWTAHVRLLTVAASCFAVLSGCTDRSGLDLGQGGALGSGGLPHTKGGALGIGGATTVTGGSTTGGVIAGASGIGSGGQKVSGGAVATGGSLAGSGGSVSATGGSTARPDAGVGKDAITCGPLCDLYCPYGNVYSNGCPTCACNPGPDAGVVKDALVCPPVCAIYCPYGNVYSNGCPTCTCNPGPDAGVIKDALICPPVCDIYCLYGNVYSNGCPTCACNPAPDAAADAVAKDGNVICPAIRCKACPFGYLKDEKGCDTCACAPDPSTPCRNLTTQSECSGASDNRCRWLAPGCGTPALNAAACYDQKLVDCDGDCPDGLSCLERSVHPCPGGKCAACGVTLGICL